MSSAKDVVTVFIVEDQPIVRAGLMFMLQELENIKVIGEATDGKTAVSKVLELRPDVTLMDISLQELDGISATRMIKQKWPEAKILVLTTHENDEYVFASLTAGADGYCLKNATGDQLGLAISVLSSGTVWLDPGIAQRVLRSYVDLAHKPANAPEKGNGDQQNAVEEQKKKTNLSDRELQVLRMLVEGIGNEEMADRMSTDEETIKSFTRQIVDKLAVADRTQAAITALKDGLVSLDCVTWRILRDARMKEPDL